MDHLRERLDALEQQVHILTQHTQMATRQLRWWRGLAGGLAVVSLLSWGVPLGLAREDGAAKDTDPKGLAQRVAALESLLKHFSRKGNEVFIKGANPHIRNGLGSTDCTDEHEEPIPDCPNGLGNLIVGYNEPRGFEPDFRIGSHNVVVGQQHNFFRFGGIVVGIFDTISGPWSAVSGGAGNTASGIVSSVSGGSRNTASGLLASVSGGVICSLKRATRPPVISPPSAADTTARPKASSTGWPAASSKTTRGVAAVVSRLHQATLVVRHIRQRTMRAHGSTTPTSMRGVERPPVRLCRHYPSVMP